MATSVSPPPVDLPTQRKRVLQPPSSSSESEDLGEETKKRSKRLSSPSSEQELRRSKRTKPSSSRRQSNPVVYLLDKKAVGSAGTSKPETQEKFLQIMGVVDEVTFSEVEVDSPLTQEAANILAVANSHRYSRLLESIPNTDGLYLEEKLEGMMTMWKQNVYQQCNCVAHKELLLEGKPPIYKRHIRQLLRTSTPLQNDTGILFAVSFLELLLTHLGKSNFVAQRSGVQDGVSYVLLANEEEFMFRGYPDFAVRYESETIANRILVVMGEIQSTRDPATQNAIYAIGNLMNTSRNELLVLTILKSKSASTSVVRLNNGPSSPANVLGVVSLKFFVSPHPVDLTQPKGVADLAYRLNVYTNSVRI